MLGCVRDIITISPAPANIYEQVKARIIATYGPSDETKLLLRGQVGTDGNVSRMSLILSRLRGLDGNIEDNVIRSTFLDQLPREHRAILVATGVADLNRLAEDANRMTESTLGVESYASTVTKENTPSPVETDIQQLITSMAAFFKKFEKLEKE